jgi:hypothetical protein
MGIIKEKALIQSIIRDNWKLDKLPINANGVNVS